MKKKLFYLSIVLFVVVGVSIFVNSNVSHSLTEQQACAKNGYNSESIIYVNLNTDGGTHDGEVHSYYLHIGNNDLPKPEKDGYKFREWYYDNKPVDYTVKSIPINYNDQVYGERTVFCYEKTSITVDAQYDVES